MRDLSIVLPVHDAQQIVTRALGIIADHLHDHRWDAEVVVVDDASTDLTVAAVRGSAYRFDHLLLVPATHAAGIARAARLGLLAASGRHRVVCHVDRPDDVVAVDHLVARAAAEPVPPAVITARPAARTGAPPGKRRPGPAADDPLWLRLVARLGDALTRRLAPVPTRRDAMVMMAGEVTAAVLRHCREDGPAFAVEMAAVAARLGHHVIDVELPEVGGRPLTAGSVFDDVLDAWRLRRRDEPHAGPTSADATPAPGAAADAGTVGIPTPVRLS